LAHDYNSQNEVGWPDQIPEEGRQEKIKKLHLEKTEIFMKLIDDGQIPLRSGVLRLVDEALSHNVKLAVCSTSSELAVTNLVQTLMGKERSSKFQIFAGDMVKAKKPAPDVYLMAVDTMELDKSRCVIIEDSHIGVRAAVAAGIACLVTKSSYTSLEDFTGAKMIVDELGEDAATGVTIETLTSLLEGTSTPDEEILPSSPPPAAAAEVSTSWDRIGHVEKAGSSWTGARFGDQHLLDRPRTYTSSETYEYKSKGKGIGVKMVSHVESGGASWTGARFGDYGAAPLARPYTPSETYEFKSSKSKSAGAQWDSIAHVEVPPDGTDENAWSGARFGDKDGRRCAPTPSKWHE
jgi:HAD superfamily hydrolase (TIGR01509 family)